jgi:hypothetical protein
LGKSEIVKKNYDEFAVDRTTGAMGGVNAARRKTNGKKKRDNPGATTHIGKRT